MEVSVIYINFRPQGKNGQFLSSFYKVNVISDCNLIIIN